jgi:acyl carrier protein
MAASMANTDYESVRSRLSALFSEVMHVQVPSAGTDLFDTGILDSQRFVELLLYIEQNFNTHIDIQDFEVENFRCIEKIATLILRQNGGNGAAQSSHANEASAD